MRARINWVPRGLSPGESDRVLKLATQLHLFPRLKIPEAIHPLPQMPNYLWLDVPEYKQGLSFKTSGLVLLQILQACHLLPRWFLVWLIIRP
jgi:hypothetical protein